MAAGFKVETIAPVKGAGSGEAVAAPGDTGAVGADTSVPLYEPPRVVAETIVPAKPQVKPDEEGTAWYWIGLTPKCPLSQATVGGVAIQQISERVTPGSLSDGTLTGRQPIAGSYLKLTKKEVARFKAAMQQTCIWQNGAVWQTGRYDKFDNGDPLAWYAYMVRVDRPLWLPADNPLPQTMAQREALAPTAE